MATITIRSKDRTSFMGRVWGKERIEEFEYDEGTFLFSDAAQDHIELLLMMNHSFTVDFQTEGTLKAAQTLNDVTWRMLGGEH